MTTETNRPGLLTITVGRTYRAKKPCRIAEFPKPLVNDRTIRWIGAFELQYDGPSVKLGRHYPRMSIEAFRQWADRDVTAELPPGQYAPWPPIKPTTTTTMTTNRHLTCCVCSAPAGQWAQHWNRDTGYGICTQCAAEQSGRETPERMQSLYGLPGINYQQPIVKVAGRVFNVMAMFHNTADGTKKANAYMERTPGAAVLEVSTTRIYIAHQDDKGLDA